jgi:hypothetical protein
MLSPLVIATRSLRFPVLTSLGSTVEVVLHPQHGDPQGLARDNQPNHFQREWENVHKSLSPFNIGKTVTGIAQSGRANSGTLIDFASFPGHAFSSRNSDTRIKQHCVE